MIKGFSKFATAFLITAVATRCQLHAEGSIYVITKNFSVIKQTPSDYSNTVSRLGIGESVNILYIENEWAYVYGRNKTGFVKLETFYESNPIDAYIEIDTAAYTEVALPTEAPVIEDEASFTYDNTSAPDLRSRASKVTYPEWEIIKTKIFKLNTPAEIYDVGTGKIYYVQSFSNGNHADVEPITKEDTKIMFETFGNEWSWDVRPVWVTINGVSIAGSINGMPHASQTIYDNDMDGQICIHFKGSATHNGNQSYTQLHQDVAQEAYDLALKYRK